MSKSRNGARLECLSPGFSSKLTSINVCCRKTVSVAKCPITDAAGLVSTPQWSERATSWVMMGLLIVLAVLATVLGAIGIYAVLAHHVALNKKGIGVRMALGAPPGVVVKGVVRSGLVLAGNWYFDWLRCCRNVNAFSRDVVIRGLGASTGGVRRAGNRACHGGSARSMASCYTCWPTATRGCTSE